MTGLPNRREFLTTDNGQPAKPLPERTTHLEVLMVDIHRFTRIGSRESMTPASTPPGTRPCWPGPNCCEKASREVR